MGKHYSQLTSEGRIALSTLEKVGHGKTMIAEHLGVHRSTVYRELKRNGLKVGYLPIVAERKIKERKRRKFKLTEDESLREQVLSKLSIGWSPEQIAGRLRMENEGKSLISHETIYSYIYSDMEVRNQWYSCLRKKRRFRRPRVGRKPRTLIPNRVAIADRPSDINERLSFGHWEGDLMLFKQGVKTNLITLRERKSRLFVAIKNPTKQAESTASNIIDRLGQFDDIVVKSLTFDNGLEFARHEAIAERLGAKTYFCDPYKSYQKGSVENGNGVMREWLPRTADIEHTSQQQINAYAKQMNGRPMKLMGYRTPEEVFWAEKTASCHTLDTS